MADRLALFTGGRFADSHAKTAHGILRYGDARRRLRRRRREAGGVASDVVPYARRPVPIVATVAEAMALGANVLVIGVAPFGGALTDEWRAALLEAIAAGMDVEAGLHTVLAEDPELSAAAAARRRRAARPARRAAGPERAAGRDRPDVRVVHTVGSDCAIGKMSVTLELDAAARARGWSPRSSPPGRPGSRSPAGASRSTTSSRTSSPAPPRGWSQEGAERAPLLFVEGQGALGHPAYSGVTLGPAARLPAGRAGALPPRGRDRHRRLPRDADPAAARAVALYEARDGWVRPAQVAAIALNTRGLDDAAAQAASPRARRRPACPPTTRCASAPSRCWTAVV